jgi:hypothetical protein
VVGRRQGQKPGILHIHSMNRVLGPGVRLGSPITPEHRPDAIPLGPLWFVRSIVKWGSDFTDVGPKVSFRNVL